VDGALFKLLFLYRVEDGHVFEPELGNGKVKGLVFGTAGVTAEVERFDSRYGTRRRAGG
jgi:hypothetical protein